MLHVQVHAVLILLLYIYTCWADALVTHVHVCMHVFNVLYCRADAPIVGHMLEYICNLEEKRASEFYGPDGYCNGELNKLTPKPLRMKWELSEAVCT